MFVYDDDETFTKNAFISLKIGANLPISSAILRQMTHSCNSFEKCKLHVRKVGPYTLINSRKDGNFAFEMSCLITSSGTTGTSKLLLLM